MRTALLLFVLGFSMLVTVEAKDENLVGYFQERCRDEMKQDRVVKKADVECDPDEGEGSHVDLVSAGSDDPTLLAVCDDPTPRGARMLRCIREFRRGFENQATEDEGTLVTLASAEGAFALCSMAEKEGELDGAESYLNPVTHWGRFSSCVKSAQAERTWNCTYHPNAPGRCHLRADVSSCL
ncbi:MAG: hypothetical protein A2284_14915 [Deltaproteobacteria bacterium RIFOXYA12_FULL_61_11]|nr:MAG: hypothetical protein A2284_14915 [Deltaproteobacteria bacterium RIFOXYA12_FULL_61_11]